MRPQGARVTEYVRLRLVPVSLTEARRFVAEVHRHNDPPITHKASVGVADDTGKLRGVGILGMPVARKNNDGRTLEIVRVASDGVANGCSMLYGALVRVAWNLGYDRVLTYTLEEESGSSLRAAGWTWDRLSDKRTDHPWDPRPNSLTAQQKPTLFYEVKMPTGRKVRWVIERSTT